VRGRSSALQGEGGERGGRGDLFFACDGDDEEEEGEGGK
jgi:hypothetical protein